MCVCNATLVGKGLQSLVCGPHFCHPSSYAPEVWPYRVSSSCVNEKVCLRGIQTYLSVDDIYSMCVGSIKLYISSICFPVHILAVFSKIPELHKYM